jgi:hypothetical protein
MSVTQASNDPISCKEYDASVAIVAGRNDRQPHVLDVGHV